MSDPLAGRVAIVTGAGRGLGRSHALTLAREGAKVVVNDYGTDEHGGGTDATPAAQVVAEIRAIGGDATASAHDVADWQQAAQLVDLAVATFGDLDVLVNNAGILRDRTIAKMSEDEWDAVIRVHLKGHAAPMRRAFEYWRDQHQAGNARDRVVIHTSSLAGIAGNFGQGNYAAAKMGIVGLSRVAAIEGARYGIRSNALSPSAATRLAGGGALNDEGRRKLQEQFDPSRVSALVAWLARPDCPATSQVFHIGGGTLHVFAIPTVAHTLRSSAPWTSDSLDEILRSNLVEPIDARPLIGHD
jgi:NAD(P)-dependent dehydrogenase (short-subunit alcohol dehydrogenase family)